MDISVANRWSGDQRQQGKNSRSMTDSERKEQTPAGSRRKAGMTSKSITDNQHEQAWAFEKVHLSCLQLPSAQKIFFTFGGQLIFAPV